MVAHLLADVPAAGIKLHVIGTLEHDRIQGVIAIGVVVGVGLVDDKGVGTGALHGHTVTVEYLPLAVSVQGIVHVALGTPIDLDLQGSVTEHVHRAVVGVWEEALRTTIETTGGVGAFRWYLAGTLVGDGIAESIGRGAGTVAQLSSTVAD